MSTYRGQRLQGLALVHSLGIFYLIGGVGAVAKIGVCSFAFTSHYAWSLAGLAGVIVGPVGTLQCLSSSPGTSVARWRL